MYSATSRMIIRFRPSIDISYGVFLWGFPIQQSLAHWLPQLSRVENCILSILIAVSMGFLSWVLVESNAIKLGKKVAMRFSVQ